ncbi:MAG: ATP-binding cassette domain-containing protein [Methanomassiliicoccus sp.]|nr:ATP-binding cassette domain-containing protein [Methanomassiliicoccus sp.]
MGDGTVDDIIIVDRLEKNFEDIRAVDGISFSVQRGEIFGFLGPNGAGKSTTIKVLTTLIRKDEGEVLIDGLDLSKQPDQVRRIIGYASQEVGVDNDLTARENLYIQCRYYHLPKERAREKVESLLRTVNLAGAGDRKLSTFSGGMRKRLDLATALVSDPKVLFLDEPTTGLDPKSRRELWDYIRLLNRQGATIFLTTQYMEEADQLADRLCIIDQGRIVSEGVPESLKAQIGGDTIAISFPDDPELISRAKDLLGGLPQVRDIRDCEIDDICENGLVLTVTDGSSAMPLVVRTLDGQGIEIKKLTLAEPTLDDVFLKLTGRTLKVSEKEDGSRKGRRGRRSR